MLTISLSVNKKYNGQSVQSLLFLKRQKKFLSILLLLICSSYSYSQNCDCTEYIYLNEPLADAVLKFEVAPGMVDLINVAGAGNAFIDDDELIDFPHGVTMDVNGNLWVGSTQASGDPIRKFTCEGDYIGDPDNTLGAPMAGVAGPDDVVNSAGILTNLFYANGFLYGTSANPRGTSALQGGPTKFDPCTGLQIGSNVCLNTTGPGLAWGMWYDEMTGYVYTTTNAANGSVYQYMLADVDAAVLDQTMCFSPIITGLFANGNAGSNINRIFGVTTDAAGNIYVVARNNNNLEGQIFKYDALGNFIGTSVVDTDAYPDLMGIVYSMTTDQLYVSTADVSGTDCIAVFDTDLNYLGTGAPNGATASDRGKGIAIIKECCPTAGNTTFNFSYCEEDFPGFIEISELYECDGVVCEAPWVQSAPVMGIIYDDCKEAIIEITPDFEGGCVTFTKGYTPPDPSARCEAFMITLNVEIVKKAKSTIAAPSICGSPFTSEITTDAGQATDMVTYQWQKSSPPAAFADISGATSATYTPATNPSATDCFRLITTTTGSCLASDNAMCSDTSNVAKFTIDCPECPATTPEDDTDAICDGTLDTEISTWQTAVVTTNTAALGDMSTAAAVLYSSSLVDGVVLVPDGTVANGTWAGPGCVNEAQTTYAYLHCYGVNGALGGGDDMYILIGTHELTIYPPAQQPLDDIVDCVNTPVAVCTGDVFGAATNPMGGAAIANWDGTSYTSQPGDPVGSVDISASTTNGCTATFTIQTAVCPPDCHDLACIGNINLSLDGNCTTEITAAMLLEYAPNNPSSYEITITDDYGNEVSNLFDFTQIGTCYDVSVGIPDCGANTCWGRVCIEDKFAPTIDCGLPVLLPCNATEDDYPDPIVMDNCGGVEFVLINETTTVAECESYLRIIERTYIAVDAQGKESTPCTQTITIDRVNTAGIQFPANFSSNVCTTSTDPLTTGVPMFEGKPIFPDVPGALCNVFVTFEDIPLGSGDCNLSFTRVWRVGEWYCGTTANLMQWVQMIEVNDLTPPSISCPANMTVTTSGGYGVCEATVTLPPATANDDCNNPVEVNVLGGPEVLFTNGGEMMLPVGTTTLTYVAYDGCYNSSTCEMTVTVGDETQPTIVCKLNTVVSLQSSGLAEVLAEVFDNGSFDDCQIDRFEAARMDDICNVSGTDFGPSVTFCCADVGNEVMVRLRVYDSSGNHNECMVAVEVQDKEPATLTCPPNETVECTTPYDINNMSIQFGTYTVDDNCADQLVTETVVEDIDQCGLGTVRRTFSMPDGLGGTLTCTQIISFTNSDPFDGDDPNDLIWPLDLTINGMCTVDDVHPDNLSAPFNFPIITEDACDLVGVNYEDQVFDFVAGEDACFKVLRTWKVVDWCQNVNGTFDTWEHEQIIKVTNNVAPTFVSGCEDQLMETLDCNAANVTLIATGSDDCTTAQGLGYSYTIENLGDGSTVATGNTNDASGSFDLGIYEITWILLDGCGNEATCSSTFEIISNKAPVAYCIQGLSTELIMMDTDGDGIPDTEMVELWASDFDAGSFHPCGYAVTLSFSSDPTDTNITFDCSQQGQQGVQLWVTDENGNQTFCNTFVIVDDNDNSCPEMLIVDVQGRIFTEVNENVEDVEVVLDGSADQDMTSEVGEYVFEDMPISGAYVIDPGKNDDVMNGVSTLDLVMIQKHLLQLRELDSPYKLIAADINHDEKVTAIDLIQLRKLILGVVEEFPANTSWRFVDALYEFPIPTDPWDEAFPEEYYIPALNTNMAIDFIGVKIGDVNNSVEANWKDEVVENRNSSSLDLNCSDRCIAQGEQIRVDIRSSSFNDIHGVQMTLEHKGLSLVSIESGVLNITDSNAGKLKDYLTTLSWNDQIDALNSVNSNDVLFTIVFEGDQESVLSDCLKVTSAHTRAEAYKEMDKDGKYAIMQIDLNITDKESLVQLSDIALKQNEPNPWNSSTSIIINSKVVETGLLTITDKLGRIIISKDVDILKGTNQIILTSEDLPAPGIYPYTIEVGEEIYTKKMLRIE